MGVTASDENNYTGYLIINTASGAYNFISLGSQVTIGSYPEINFEQEAFTCLRTTPENHYYFETYELSSGTLLGQYDLGESPVVSPTLPYYLSNGGYCFKSTVDSLLAFFILLSPIANTVLELYWASHL